MFLANNFDEFKKQFSLKLRSMLTPDELGVYILVLANSIQDDEISELLSDALNDINASLQENIKDKTFVATKDDLLVYEKLQNLNNNQLASWEQHQLGAWQVYINPFRSLRPARNSSAVVKNIKQDFQSDVFNFNKPFLKPEILWEGVWQDTEQQAFDLRVLYNKFPFIPYHLIIVPNPELQLPQYLTSDYHQMMWQLVNEANQYLPGFAAGYNSIGACASVNQLHFQSFIQSSALPIELSCWQHNGGHVLYPMNCLKFNNDNDSWAAIQNMHENNAPYNILYRPNCCYLIPRQMQGSATVEDSVSGAGWIEECGVFMVANIDEYKLLSENRLMANLKSLSAK